MKITSVELCNNALDLIGSGRMLKSMEDFSPEGEACARLYQPSLELCLDMFNWSFARKDEVIDDKELLKDVVSLPYRFSYKVPDDVMKILFLSEMEADYRIDTRVRGNRLIQYNLRNVDDQRVIATDHAPGFVIHYQAYINDLSLCPALFREGLSFMLAAKLAASLLKGTTGVSLHKEFYQNGMFALNNAAANDATQGAETVSDGVYSSFLKSRR